jgi:hypothetical protein
MRQATNVHSTQVLTLFGGGYVPEQHTDETPGNLAPVDIDEAVISLTVSMFSEVLKSLRSALCLR